MQVRAAVKLLLSDSRMALAPHQLEVTKQLDRLAMQSGVAASVLARLLASGAAPTPSFDFSLHPYFPAVALKGAKRQLAPPAHASVAPAANGTATKDAQ